MVAIIQIGSLPIAYNVCNLQLKEVWRSPTEETSIAHVAMGLGATSLLHMHRSTTEVYHILEGIGTLLLNDRKLNVAPGDVIVIPPNTAHKISNTGHTGLVFLVTSVPAFDPKDVVLLEDTP